MDDIIDADEVTSLLAMFIDQGGLPLKARDVKMANTPVYGFKSAKPQSASHMLARSASRAAADRAWKLCSHRCAGGAPRGLMPYTRACGHDAADALRLPRLARVDTSTMVRSRIHPVTPRTRPYPYQSAA